MDVLGWIVLIVGAIGVVLLGDFLVKRFFGGDSRVKPHESADAQANQHATRSHLNGGGFGPQG